MDQHTRENKPRCPHCGDSDPIEVGRERMDDGRWATVWSCTECGHDWTVPEKTKEE